MTLPLPLQVEYLDALAAEQARQAPFDPARFREAAHALTLAQGVDATDTQIEAAIQRVIVRHSTGPAPTSLAWARPVSREALDQERHALAKRLYRGEERINPTTDEPASIGLLVGILGIIILAGIGLHTALTWGPGLLLAATWFTGSLALGVWLQGRLDRFRANLVQWDQRHRELPSVAPTQAQLARWHTHPAAHAFARQALCSDIGMLAGDVMRLDAFCAAHEQAQADAALAASTARFLQEDPHP